MYSISESDPYYVEELSEEHYEDFEELCTSKMKPDTSNSLKKCKPWNGNPAESFLTAVNRWDIL